MVKVKLRITACIWIRYASPNSALLALGQLQIHQNHHPPKLIERLTSWKQKHYGDTS